MVRVRRSLRGWPRLFFQRVPEGKAALEAECARLLPLGAMRVRLLYDGHDSCLVMQDAEGNEFCLD